MPSPQRALSPSRPEAQPGAVDEVLLNSTQAEQVPPKIEQVLAHLGRPYYDDTADAQARGAYYQAIDLGGDSSQLFERLSALVRRTHTNRLAFKPEKYLHPWVDLRPNLRLQSIYSAEPIATDSPVQVTRPRDFVQKIRVRARGYKRANGTYGPDRWANKRVDFRQQATQWGQVLLEGAGNALEVAQRIALIEGYRYYNAEHSVPQFVFDRDKDAKGDLHHLFTCERGANSIRQHYRYGEVPETEGNRKGEGWVNHPNQQFDPEAGKGAVARATLYFLLRYPGKLGDKSEEYTPEDIQTLLQWHREEPVSLYELHRNRAIEEIQGNRNPLIDFPELAERIDFTQGLGEATRPG